MKNKLWDADNQRVLLARFEDSAMKRETVDALVVVDDYYRAKTYAKPEDILKPIREMPFMDPFMVAQARTGGTWNDHNAPFTIQVAGCNANCPYCFVPRELRSFNEDRGHWFTAKDIVAIRHDKEPGRKTIRVSGGEPFLVPEFLKTMGDALASWSNLFLWIDTNLLGKSYHDVIESLCCTVKERFGICGCFKGFDPDSFSVHSGLPVDRYEDQWSNAAAIFDAMSDNGVSNNLFFYVPEIVFSRRSNPEIFSPAISSFMDRLQDEIHENAPLRVTVLSLKEYHANKGWENTLAKKLGSGYTIVEHGLTSRAWNDAITARFPVEMRWLPQYQVPMN